MTRYQNNSRYSNPSGYTNTYVNIDIGYGFFAFLILWKHDLNYLAL